MQNSPIPYNHLQASTDPRQNAEQNFMDTIRNLYMQAMSAQTNKSSTANANPPSSQFTPSVQMAEKGIANQEAHNVNTTAQHTILSNILQHAMQDPTKPTMPPLEDAQAQLSAYDPFRPQQAPTNSQAAAVAQSTVANPTPAGGNGGQGQAPNNNPVQNNQFLNFLMDRLNLQKGLGYAGQ